VNRSVFFALAALFLCSCATTGPYVVSEAVGPAPGFRSYGKEGMLQVFTVTTQVNDGGISYFPHTSYRLYSTNGSFLKYIRNHSSATDQRPEMVKLPAGDYAVTATSDVMGVVKVPVAIRGSQITIVCLERGQMKEFRGADEQKLVRFPNGKIVGWKAPPPEEK
jgi:hypothetical protein